MGPAAIPKLLTFRAIPWFWAAIFISWLVPGVLNAQNRKEQLQKDKERIEEEIRYNSSLLNETVETKKSTLNRLVILKKQVQDREKLISTLQQEISVVDKQIELDNQILSDLKKDLQNLKEEYARMIYFAYKNRSFADRLMFVFAAEDFNQAYLRLKYLQQYSSFRKKQAGRIEETREKINNTLEELKKYRKEKMELLLREEEEKKNLMNERELRNTVYRQLAKKEKELKKIIAEKEKAAARLQEEIEKIIAEEIRIASEKSGTTEKTGSFALTPVEMKLSEDFESNQGNLPWPVERGIISVSFGEHQHPVLKQVKTRNNGVDILTSANEEIRAVFNGVVTRVMEVPGYNYVIMIRHGEYLTVYSNLVEVSVSRGDNVVTGQVVGKAFYDEGEKESTLHFEIWKGKILQNPELWLAR